VPAEHGTWFLLSRLDGATVSTSDGTGVTYRKRDRRKFWELLRVSLALHQQVLRSWPALRRRYQDGMPELISREAWDEQVFRRFAPPS